MTNDKIVNGVRAVKWSLTPTGLPVISVRAMNSMSSHQAQALAAAIVEAAEDAHAASLVQLEQDTGGQMSFDAPLARRTDPATSHRAAGAVEVHYLRPGSQKMALMLAYRDAGPSGLTDEEAGNRSGLAARGAGYWKRCSELRRAGWITRLGETRVAQTGMDQDVCVITPDGIAAIMQANKDTV